MLKFFYVGLGGAVGAMLRYQIGNLSLRFASGGFPLGTLIVNLAGSLCIGFLWKIFEHITVANEIKLLVVIGVLGSFTTFSAFSLDNLNLFRNGQYAMFAANISYTVVLGITMVFAGYFGANFILNTIK